MAVIYWKTPTEYCLVLGSREALIYPFNLGDWNEIRISYFLSMTSVSNLNAAWADEVVYGSLTNYKQAGFWGIKDSGTIFPTQTGSVFIGHGRRSSSTVVNEANIVTESIVCAQQGGNYTYASFNSGTTGYMPQANVLPIQLSSTANSVGTTSYGSFFSQKIVRTRDGPGGKTGVYYSQYVEKNIAAPYDATTTRIKALNTTYTQYLTGYWTTDFTVNGDNNTQFPNSIFIYLPFFYSRLRLHTIVVEKIS